MLKRMDVKKVFKYGLFGAISAAAEFVTFIVLIIATDAKHTYIAATISFLAGLMLSFVFNKFFVFKNSKEVRKAETVQFLVLGLMNSQVSSFITYALAFILPQVFAKIVTIGLVAGWNYLLMNFIIFKKRT